MPEVLLDLRDAAQVLSIRPATLRSYIKQGRAQAVRMGKRWRVSRAEVDRLASEGVAAPSLLGTAPSEPPANLYPPVFGHLPEVAPLDLNALFAPPTSEEIARRLAALDALGRGIDDEQDEGEELDLSGNRATLYGYEERDEDPTAGVRFDRDERDRRIMEAGL